MLKIFDKDLGSREQVGSIRFSAAELSKLYSKDDKEGKGKPGYRWCNIYGAPPGKDNQYAIAM
jgi:hypothetical protein